MLARWFNVSSYNKIKVSKDAPHDGVHYKFIYEFPISDLKSEEHLFVSVVRASIPKTWYLVTSGNNTFTMTEPGQPTATITIPVGNYNANTFAIQVSSLMTAASFTATTYTTTFSLVTGKLTYTSAPARATQLIFPAALAEGIHDQAGFIAGTTNTFTAGTLTSTTVCSFVAQDNIIIKSNICISPMSVLQDINSSTVPFGASIVWASSDIHGNAKPFSGKNSTFEFAIQDLDGHNLDTNGRPVSFTLCIFRDTSLINLSALKILGPKLNKFLDRNQ